MFTNVDICTIAAVKSSESYDNLAIAFKNVFDDINNMIENPHLTIGETTYTLELFLTADYKVTATYLQATVYNHA